MLDFLATSVVLAMAASWVITLGYKWELIEAWQKYTHFELVNKMLGCDFCLSWWTNVVLAIAMAAIVGDYTILAAPFVGTIITRNTI